ncbi:hypothetical protein FGO68_gene2452 [Halteria grandinella]|uniref:Uncharacterized protein n=1 Tax=Halteria grandinella TaxID=5974 RepID=A0A8J8NG57_HALGN|nr:hypothetical protein FGO68_gene2452 [Halteria grandinella]
MIQFTLQISSFPKYFKKNERVIEKYGAVFEGLKHYSFSRYYNSFLLLKRFLFMSLLVYCYNFKVIQVSSLTFLSILNSFFLIFFKPIEDKLELCKKISAEVSMSQTLTMTTVLAIDSDIQYFGYEARENIGWCCTTFISFILVVQIFLDAIQQWKFLLNKFKFLKKIFMKIKSMFSSSVDSLPRTSPNVFEP